MELQGWSTSVVAKQVMHWLTAVRTGAGHVSRLQALTWLQPMGESCIATSRKTLICSGHVGGAGQVSSSTDHAYEPELTFVQGFLR